MGAQRAITRLQDADDLSGALGTGKAPVSNGAGELVMTDVATQAELDAAASTFAAAIAALSTVCQPVDSDLTAIAALSTTAYGRALLVLADAAALRTAAGLGTAATHAAGDFDAAGAAAAAQAASQPLDSDLTAIANLATTAFGRALLVLADQAALLTAVGAAAAAHVHAGEDITSGTVADARIAGTIARDSEVTAAVAAEATARDSAITSAIAALVNSAPGVLDTLEEIADALGDDPNFAATMTSALAGKQPLDSDLTAIAALATTSFGRAFLTLADDAAARLALGLGTAALHATGDFDAAGAAAAAQAASQPLDSDLTAIAALTTTTFGRAFLALADAAAGRTALGLGTLATQSGTFSGNSSGTNTGDQTSVSGNAGTATALQTARNIDGQAFDGSAAITVIAPGTHAAASKATPVDADELPLVDSAAANVLKKLTWANLKATLKTYFDTLYAPIGGGSVTKQILVPLSIPDASGNGYAALIATANIRELVAGFLKDVDGDWWGIVRVPKDYASAGTIILRVAANSTAGLVTSFIVSTKVRDTAATWDAALTDETVVDMTLSTTAYRPTDVSFTLTTTPTAGNDLIVRIRHNGLRTQDTLTVDTLLLQAVFQYST